MRILLVDDEKELREALSQILVREGYAIETADNGQAGLQLAQSQDYDLLILDWMLPEYSGITICKQIRIAGKATPVLILTAKDTIDDRVQGLDAGADDYLVKPFELRELLARVRALLRRSPIIEPPERLKIADLDLDKENQVAYRNGKMIRLSDRELQLLTYFMENAEQLLTHEQIYQHLWQDETPPSSNVLAALIRLLRRKVETKGDRPLIHTIYGKGYYFGLQDT
ncbi:two component transcriptional regulator, winged helix family [[Leptolyngbya] sp. PCC 7376]|uniref:two-component system response regulator RppA n=1 Tax=[Leptolyngbya] sp. PCC 7376 TaxID=111781 RepID=UPI00029EFD7B|nr:two-component system response regulator RppA [[Leptolyngbya] sp. PCC 7376]AFY37666.1 two component transcriptional regulator, winged helix family [[Leptolyngbya] sp. PCC 7376]